MRETAYQRKLIHQIEDLIPGSVVIKLPADQIQGIPDLIVLYKNRFCVLEAKMNSSAPFQPNQEYYLEHFGQYTFASVIYPENEEEVLNALQHSLGAAG